MPEYISRQNTDSTAAENETDRAQLANESMIQGNCVGENRLNFKNN